MKLKELILNEITDPEIIEIENEIKKAKKMIKHTEDNMKYADSSQARMRDQDDIQRLNAKIEMLLNKRNELIKAKQMDFNF